MKYRIYTLIILSCLIFFYSEAMALEMPTEVKVDGDVKVYTYESDCECDPVQSGFPCSKGEEQTIIVNQSLSSWNTSYIFQHGDGSRDWKYYCNALKVCQDLKNVAKNTVFVGFKMAGGSSDGTKWSHNYNAVCLHNEAEEAVNKLLGAGKFPQSKIIASYSQGGIAVSRMFKNNKQPANIASTLFFDSCYASNCKTVADKPTSVRGIMKMYRSTKQPDSKEYEEKNAEQNETATLFMNSSPPPSTSVTVVDGKHSEDSSF